MLSRMLLAALLLFSSEQALAASYLLIKLNPLDGKKLPTLLAIQSRKVPKNGVLSKEILRHRGRHVELSGDLSLIELEPGLYQLVHFDMTRRYSDPNTRYIDFIPVDVRPNTVTYFGDFDLVEHSTFKVEFRDATIFVAAGVKLTPIVGVKLTPPAG